MKLLIDECLSPELAKLAQSRGHESSSHVVWLKKSDWKDWSLKTFILGGDWTFVTKNRLISGDERLSRVPKANTQMWRSTPGLFASMGRQA